MIEVLHRAVRVLDVLRVAETELSIRQVAQHAELSKSTVQRLLRELVDLNLASQDPSTARYRLGPRTLALGSAYQRRLNVRSAALPHMTKLRDSTGETVGLSVGLGDQVIHIDQVESASELRAMFEIGRPLPLWSGAPSRLLLAELDEADVQRIAHAERRADLSPINPPEPNTLIELVRQARSEGFAVAIEETLPGVSTLAAPIRSSTGDLVGTVSVTSPTIRMTPEVITLLRPQVIDAGHAISAELGWLG
ncbi:IclR family transcriptional regulator domain-containing protein [Actinopolymorpha rutila]|uniref:Glycerol operon regulatory protein n=1 Tax=Actinopolymorpha rutila TaxID=446787 RepID=A0A852ZQF6_9ACTN|nr:DNA-binding IclR family transcriptional regulator [Actinopolymorpha rutila]